MNITSVSSSSNVSFLSLNNDNVIKVLEKQEMQLQDQIQKVNESKLDNKTKQDRIKQLQDQIQQIDMEIQEKRTEKVNHNNGKEQSAADSQNSTNSINGDTAENSLSGMSDLMQAASSYSNAKLINNTKSKMQINIQITKTEIKLDDFTSNYKEKNIQSMESKIKSLDDKFADTIHTAQEHIKEYARHISSEQPKNNKDDAKAESVSGTSNSKESKAENTETAVDKEKEKYENQKSTGKQTLYRKVDLKA